MKTKTGRAWLTKKEARSFIETFVACANCDLDSWQKKSLTSFYRYFIGMKTTKTFVFTNLATVAEQCGVPPPDYKDKGENGTLYRFWKDDTLKGRWESHLNDTLDDELMKHGMDRTFLELKIQDSGDRLSDALKRIDHLEAQVAVLIEYGVLPVSEWQQAEFEQDTLRSPGEQGGDVGLTAPESDVYQYEPEEWKQ